VSDFVVVRVANNYVKSYIKDPTARLDYTWDWAKWLDDIDDTIGTATVALPEGLTAVGDPVVNGAFVTQVVEDGDLGSVYRMICHITTEGGRVDQRSIYLTIGDR
jgi:hypothetical protein